VQTTYYYYVQAVNGNNGAVFGPMSPEASATTEWGPALTLSDTDIGGPAPAGAASFAASSGIYTVSGGGAGIGGAADSFNFAYNPSGGDTSFSAQVQSVQCTDPLAAAGVMFRNSTGTAGDMMVFLGVTAADGLVFETRTSSGAVAQLAQLLPGVAAPVWLDLTRNGTSFTAYYSVAANPGVCSSGSSNWVQLGPAVTVPMASFDAGLAVSAHSSSGSALNTSTFFDVDPPLAAPAGAPVAITPPATAVSTAAPVAAASSLPAKTSHSVTFVWDAAPTAGASGLPALGPSARPMLMSSLSRATKTPAAATSIKLQRPAAVDAALQEVVGWLTS
jgi:hypothetical protein